MRGAPTSRVGGPLSHVAAPRREHSSGTWRKDPAPPPPPRLHGAPPATPPPSPAVPTRFQALNRRPGGARPLDAGRSRIPAEPADSGPGAHGTSPGPGRRASRPGGARERGRLQRPRESPRASPARPASAQPLGLGPSEARRREPRPPAGFGAGFRADVPTSPENNRARGHLEREGARDAPPPQSLPDPWLRCKAGRKGAAPRRAAPRGPGSARLAADQRG